MSYWTFSDLFEEPGPQTRAFDGGFGLMNPQGVRKPTWFAYKYLNSLGDLELAISDPLNQSIAARDGDTVQVLAWRYEYPNQTVSNRPFYRAVHPSGPAAPLAIEITGLAPGSYTASVRRVGFRQNDAYTAWLEMGSPERLTNAQVEQLQRATLDQSEAHVVMAGEDGVAQLDLPMNVHDVVLVEFVAAR